MPDDDQLTPSRSGIASLDDGDLLIFSSRLGGLLPLDDGQRVGPCFMLQTYGLPTSEFLARWDEVTRPANPESYNPADVPGVIVSSMIFPAAEIPRIVRELKGVWALVAPGVELPQ